jgi:hypothetical protein
MYRVLAMPDFRQTAAAAAAATATSAEDAPLREGLADF